MGHAWRVLGPPVPAATPRVVARVEWDRGHDEFVGVVYLDEPEGIVVARTHDYWPQAGCLWIRRSEVLSLRELDEADPEVRVLNELGVRLFALDPEITELATLLGHAVDTPSPVAVYSESSAICAPGHGRTRGGRHRPRRTPRRCALGVSDADGAVRRQRPRQDSNLRTRLRRPMLYPLSYEGWVDQPSARACSGSQP